MQEVLRKLYQDHRSSIQRKRIHKVLKHEQYLSPTRKRYDFRDQTRIKTPETTYSFDQDIRFEKQFHKVNRFNLPDLEAKFIKPKGNLKRNQQKKQRLRKKLKAAFISILFLQRLKTQLRQSLLKRKRKAEKYSQYFVVHTQKLIHQYYEKLLKEDFLEYCSILHKHLLKPDLNQQKQIVTFLYYLTNKLASSSLTKEITGFFVYTASERGFPPSDFLSLAQINRLDFSTEYGCLINVSEEQIRMIIGLGVGIKIFCFYLLYKPWNLQCAQKELFLNRDNLKDYVKNIGSIIYFIIMEQFCLNVKEVRTVNKSMISNLRGRSIRQLDPLEEGQTGSTSKSLICNQNRQFLNQMTEKYPNLIASIKKNIYIWISRISYACLKESEKKRQTSNPHSTFYQTKASTSRNGTPDKIRFRSIELKRKQNELENSKKRKYNEFPQLKSIII